MAFVIRIPKLLNRVILQILKLEFSHYDFKSQGSISAKDFALSIVAAADINHIDKLLDRVEALNKEHHFKNIRITYEEFKHFAELRKKLEPFSLAIFSYGKVNGELTKQDFQRAASQVSITSQYLLKPPHLNVGENSLFIII